MLLVSRNPHLKFPPLSQHRAANFCSCVCHQRNQRSDLTGSSRSSHLYLPRLAPSQSQLRRFLHLTPFVYSSLGELSLQAGILRDYLKDLLHQYETSQETLLTGRGDTHQNNEDVRGMQPVAERMRAYLQAENEIEELHSMILGKDT